MKEPVVEYYIQEHNTLRSIGAAIPILLTFPEGAWLYVRGYKAKVEDILATNSSEVATILEDSRTFGLLNGATIVCKMSELQAYIKHKQSHDQ
jgi:hypothetical protein